MDTRYEHHMSIRKNRLCPFLLNTVLHTSGSPCNWHRNIELILITEGTGSIRYDSELIPLSLGDIVVVGPDVIHQLHSESGFSYRYLIIDEIFSEENGIDTATLDFSPRFSDDVTAGLFCLAADAYIAYEASQIGTSAARLRRAVLDLLIDLVERHSRPKEEKQSDAAHGEEYIKRVLEHLNSEFTSHITLDALASLARVSKFHLVREFKRYTGYTIMTYINILRCKRAEVAISEGMTITEAAMDAGFESLSYFSRTYKRLMGTSPSSLK